jgi:hypothetical protein
MPQGRKLEIGRHEVGSKIQELFFGLGVLLASATIGYYVVSGEFKNCMDFYGLLDSKVEKLTRK